MKTPEELAVDYCEPILSDDYAKTIGREDWIGTRCVKVGEGHEMFKAFLAGYAAAQPKWISVKERLPELGLHVLTYGIYTKDLIVAWLDDCDEFLGVYDWVNEHQSLDQVTHWMPLPEPPKEEK